MNITTANLGWWIVAFLIAGTVIGTMQERIRDRWEIVPGAPWRHRIARRWYGTHSHITLRADASADDPDRFKVLAWDDEHTAVPWLTVQRLDPEYITWLDEGAEAFCAPVTDFAPYAVRRFRPGLAVVRRLPVPWLWQYPLLPMQVRFAVDNRTPEEVNTAYYLNTASWKRPCDPPGTLAALMRGESR